MTAEKIPNTEQCPECGLLAKHLPLTRILDNKKKTVTITCECPNEHQFTVTQPLSVKG